MSFPAAEPSATHFERQARHVRLLGYGQPGVHRASSAHVVVIGAGGLGCPALQVLAAAGVGTLTFVDDDVVERSNLARQILFRESDIGRSKVDAAADALRGLGPDARLVPRQVRLDERSAPKLIREADVVIDTTDHWPTRFAVADACREAGIPLVWGSVLGWDALLTVFVPGDENPTLDDLVNREQQLASPGLNCATAGVFAPLVAELGAAMAGEALRLVTKAGSPLVGTVRTMNGRTGRVRELPLAVAVPNKLADPAIQPTREVPAAASYSRSAASYLSADTANRSNNVPTQPPHVEIRDDELIVDVRPAAHPDLAVRHNYVHLPLETIAEHVARERLDQLPLSEPLVVACAQGPRARYAAELLESAGAEAVRTLPGGVPALAGLLDTPRPTSTKEPQ